MKQYGNITGVIAQNGGIIGGIIPSHPKPVPPTPIAKENDVMFYDYDGTVAYSYSAADFANLTAMPDNPTHEGLTAQGWNWSLADAKAYVASYGKLNVGQMYTTDNGATRLHIHLEDGRLSPYLGLCPNGTLTIDWGDGSTPEIMTGNSTSTLVYLPHTYAQAGDYVISILPSSGSTFGFTNRSGVSTLLCSASNDSTDNRHVYLNAIRAINIGGSASRIDYRSFGDCHSLSSVTIPNSVTSIDNYAFGGCKSLSSVIIPNSVTSIGDGVFQNCYALSSVILSSSATSISSDIFNGCCSLSSVTIPSKVTRIVGSAFSGCSGFGYIRFVKANTPPTVSSATAFYAVSDTCLIYAPALIINLYMNGTNYPDKAKYKYIGYATYEERETLPDKTSDETHTLTWYATVDDAIAQTNPITTGNGQEVYARATAI